MIACTTPLVREYRTLSQVPRWSIVRLLRPQSVLEHTALVAVYADMIADIVGYSGDRAQLYREALRHDLAEVETGDLPSPVKKRLGPAENRESYEAEILAVRYGIHDGPADHTMHWIIKVADLTEAVLKLTEEKSLGNHSITNVLHNLLQILEEVVHGSPLDHDRKEALWSAIGRAIKHEYAGQDGVQNAHTMRGSVLFNEALAK